MNRKTLCAFLIGLSLSGCAHIHTMKTTFDANELRWFSNPTKYGSVSGEAFLKKANGDVVTCAGNNVSFVPVSNYSKERMMALYHNASRGFNAVGFNYSTAYRDIRFVNEVSEPDPLYETHMLHSTCDSKGSFVLDQVPVGEYFVTTTVIWMIENEIWEGAALMKKIIVSENSKEHIIIVSN